MGILIAYFSKIYKTQREIFSSQFILRLYPAWARGGGKIDFSISGFLKKFSILNNCFFGSLAATKLTASSIRDGEVLKWEVNYAIRGVVIFILRH